MAVRQVVRYTQKEGGTGTKKQREKVIQIALTRWLNREHSDIVFFNDWASGAFLTYGQNSARASMACSHGWVDLFFAEPRGGHHGLFIELKKEDARVFLKDGVTLCADPQIHKEYIFLEKMRDRGYKAEFAIGEEEAKRLISDYFGWPHSLDNVELF